MEKILGIMTRKTKNVEKFLPYLHVALEEGFSDIVVFTPADVDLHNNRVNGYVYTGKVWKRKKVPFMIISYDVGYYSLLSTIRKVQAIKKHKNMPFIGYGLGNKWKIQRMLSRFADLQPYLIPTQPLTDAKGLASMVHQHGTVILKPINGKEGKGILRLHKREKGYELEENDQTTQFFSEKEGEKMTQYVQKRGNHLIQRWIDIRNRDGIVYDIRSLMQKNGQGEWKIVGMAVREGGTGRITSNLMDGGKPFPVEEYLQDELGFIHAQRIRQALQKLSYRIPTCIELAYGKRQSELGLDLCVDKNGKIWIIEVNSKPGKLPFASVFDIKTMEDAVRMPIGYAYFVAKSLRPNLIK